MAIAVDARVGSPTLRTEDLGKMDHAAYYGRVYYWIEVLILDRQ